MSGDPVAFRHQEYRCLTRGTTVNTTLEEISRRRPPRLLCLQRRPASGSQNAVWKFLVGG
jgi:hypothetical protein